MCIFFFFFASTGRELSGKKPGIPPEAESQEVDNAHAHSHKPYMDTACVNPRPFNGQRH